MFTLPINFPDSENSLTMFEDAATAFGWQPRIPNEETGEMIDNPINAVSWCLMEIVIPTLQRHATDVRRRRETAELDKAIADDYAAIAQDWKILNLPPGAVDMST